MKGKGGKGVSRLSWFSSERVPQDVARVECGGMLDVELYVWIFFWLCV